MIPMDAASWGLKKPDRRAAEKATNTPNCAPAPISKLLGFEIRGEKSVIAPIPMNISEGYIPSFTPRYRRSRSPPS